MPIQFADFPLSPRGDKFMGEKVVGAAPQPYTLGDMCIAALGNPVDWDRAETQDQMGFKKKLARHDLAGRIAEAEKAMQPMELDSTELAMLVQRVGGFWMNALMAGAAIKMLDPAAKA